MFDDHRLIREVGNPLPIIVSTVYVYLTELWTKKDKPLRLNKIYNTLEYYYSFVATSD